MQCHTSEIMPGKYHLASGWLDCRRLNPLWALNILKCGSMYVYMYAIYMNVIYDSAIVFLYGSLVTKYGVIIINVAHYIATVDRTLFTGAFGLSMQLALFLSIYLILILSHLFDKWSCELAPNLRHKPFGCHLLSNLCQIIKCHLAQIVHY